MDDVAAEGFVADALARLEALLPQAERPSETTNNTGTTRRRGIMAASCC
jgi:hypothetical protein